MELVESDGTYGRIWQKSEQCPWSKIVFPHS
jgi:hypothetical protein